MTIIVVTIKIEIELELDHSKYSENITVLIKNERKKGFADLKNVYFVESLFLFSPSRSTSTSSLDIYSTLK